MARPTLIGLGELHYCPFMINLDRCVASCKTIHDLSYSLCVPNKTDVTVTVFDTITKINEPNSLAILNLCNCT